LIGVLNHGVESYEHFMYIAKSKAWCSKPQLTLGGSRCNSTDLGKRFATVMVVP
jgi:hypothetical protein